VVALVQLREGPLVMGNIIGCPVEQVKIGMKVQARFREGIGGFMVPQFEPVQG